ncbi:MULTISPECIES: HD domain-containing protein [unclassified Leptolyngbya]|uniref:HD domain-containing protein n=1 Tax=unclassified Leptolyngbya TaxID=2650499 RepID=UPI001688757B|nr:MULTISPECIES: HD domain-containing protein [unclassified Leptolyngbya]MBD1912825.1 HD domain-containing protein [Leptolyngbya sp. FACHB-8]MBD2157772.1 HD domain-containing protein [Leptolyngbya sp. FACHB-16]
MILPNSTDFDPRLIAQLQFILELDRLKQILRQTSLTDNSRRENSAEHSWHLAVMAIALSEYAHKPINTNHAVQLLLLHDVVEIDAGDTFCFDEQSNQSKVERELQAAQRIFGLLPTDLAVTFRALWDEFEAGETPEAQFARAMDCFQPFLHNLQTQGGTWRKYGVSRERVLQRLQAVKIGAPALWGFVETQIAEAIAAGYLTDSVQSA